MLQIWWKRKTMVPSEVDWVWRNSMDFLQRCWQWMSWHNEKIFERVSFFLNLTTANILPYMLQLQKIQTCTSWVGVHPFTVEPEESEDDLVNEVVEPPSLQNVNSSPASSSLCYGQHCSPASSSHCYCQQSSPTPSSHCDGQHSSPASSLHLHYSESINGEGDELENCENSPCQQSSPTPSFQISEAGSAEFSEDESDERQLFFWS